MPPRRSPWLETALLFTIIIHAVAMVSMALLLPGLPGGTHDAVADRAAYIMDHPWLWRIGWFPWQVTAASDLFLGIALVCTPWVRKGPAIISALITFAAIIPDQFAQLDWTWGSGVTNAQVAINSGGFDPYLRFETETFALTAGWGAAGYTLGAIGWSLCFALSGTWSKALTRISIAVWTLFATATAVVFLPDSIRHLPAAAAAVSLGNALAFILLMAWLLCVYEAVLRRSRPVASHGVRAPWRHPSRGPLARLAELVANSRAARAIGCVLPTAAMSSDITDVVYINYLVDADMLEPLVDAPLKLQRLGPGGRYALFSFLTFRHGHFGPTIFGPLRKLWPSPIQSNWRIYVRNPATGREGVQFITTAITSTSHALATRLLAEGVPMHIPASADVRRDASGTLHVSLEPGDGSAPDVQATLTEAPTPPLDSLWSLCFTSWSGMLRYAVPQDRALSTQPWRARVIRQEISLNIPLETCRPLTGSVTSNAASAIVGDAKPICFLVARVPFSFAGEKTDR